MEAALVVSDVPTVSVVLKRARTPVDKFQEDPGPAAARKRALLSGGGDGAFSGKASAEMRLRLHLSPVLAVGRAEASTEEDGLLSRSASVSSDTESEDGSSDEDRVDRSGAEADAALVLNALSQLRDSAVATRDNQTSLPAAISSTASIVAQAAQQQQQQYLWRSGPVLVPASPVYVGAARVRGSMTSTICVQPRLSPFYKFPRRRRSRARDRRRRGNL